MTLLQNVVVPASGAAPTLYVHAEGAAACTADGSWRLDPGARLSFDTYFNLLNWGVWQAHCGLETLELQLFGEGVAELRVIHTRRDLTRDTLTCAVVDLSGGAAVDIALPAPDAAGIIHFTIAAAEGPVRLTSAAFATRDAARRRPRLAICITTYRREEAARDAAARIGSFLGQAGRAERMHLFVTDNGGTLDLPEDPRLTCLQNCNLGGAGGFARGLIEAAAQGYTHVLFIDDDAVVEMEAIGRCDALLSHAIDTSLAVAGAMINTLRPWQMWENGAIFDGKCMPQFSGTDLRDPDEVAAMEIAVNRPAPANLYGGWWFFAFPVACVRHYPFPFFVRGDDVSFCLANPFRIVTLNGIVSRSDDFTAKETPMTWYLDLRSHMVHHLALPSMARGRLRVAKIALWFFLRNLVRFQYATLATILLAVEDVMRGPEFFAEDSDMSRRRPDIAALAIPEAWRPLAELDLTERRRFDAARGWRRQLFRWTGNGHLLPFFRHWGNRVVVQPEDRGRYGPIWGASRITYLDATRDRGYTVEQSKLSFLGVSARLVMVLIRFLWGYSALLCRYRQSYAQMTSSDFWELKLMCEPTSRASGGSDV